MEGMTPMVTSFCSAEGSRVRQALHDTDSFIKFKNFVFLLYLCYGNPIIRLPGYLVSGIRLSGTRLGEPARVVRLYEKFVALLGEISGHSRRDLA